MHDAAAGGRTVLFVSHNMAAVNSLTTRALLLDKGSIVFDGPSSEATQFYVGRRQHDDTQARRPVSKIDFGRHWRRDDRLMITEMGLAADQPQTIHHGDDVRMEVMIRSDSTHERLRLAYS